MNASGDLAIAVVATTGQPIAGLQTTIRFDPAALQYLGTQVSPLPNALVHVLESPGKLAIFAAAPRGRLSDDAIVLRFKAQRPNALASIQLEQEGSDAWTTALHREPVQTSTNAPHHRSSLVIREWESLDDEDWTARLQLPHTTAPFLASVTSAALLYGDVNRSGSITVADVSLVLAIAAGKFTPTSEQFEAANVAPSNLGDGVEATLPDPCRPGRICTTRAPFSETGPGSISLGDALAILRSLVETVPVVGKPIPVAGGTLRGTISNAQRGPLAGVIVTVAPSGVTGTTTADGTFALSVPAGSIQVTLTGLPSDCTVPTESAAVVGSELTTTLDISVLCAPLGWVQLAARGAGPALVGWSAHAPDLRAIFTYREASFGSPQLWKFDLATDTWSQLPATNWPCCKYRQIVYDAAAKRLRTFWDGNGQVFSIPVAGGSWSPDGSAPNRDEYYEAASFLNPSTGRLAQFAGYGFFSFKNTLFEWDATANSWLAITQSAQRPAPTFGHGPSSFTFDLARGVAFFGGVWRGEQGGSEDLWELNTATYQWTPLQPTTTGSTARALTSLAFDPGTGRLYRYGGLILDGSFTSASGVFESTEPGTLPIAWSPVLVGTTRPSNRLAAGFFLDAPRRRLILIGGSEGTAEATDVWAFRL